MPAVEKCNRTGTSVKLCTSIFKKLSPLLIGFEQLYQECEMSRKTYIEYIFSSMGIYGALDEKVSFAQLRLKKGVTKSTDIRKMIPSYQKTLKYLSKNEVPYSFQKKRVLSSHGS